jgi:hypothetical protein
MQESRMMALTGGRAKVSGSRMAMPFAPPSPGSTPMSTPSTMPATMRMMFSGCRATEKPCIRRPISSMAAILQRHRARTWSLKRHRNGAPGDAPMRLCRIGMS